MKHGIQYIEVRCIDIDPFEPLGISPKTARFLDAFLLFCALSDSPRFPAGSCHTSEDNFNKVVNEGRHPALMLHHEGQSISLKEWGLALIEQIRPFAMMLDDLDKGNAYVEALAVQQAKLNDVTLCPSHKVIEMLQAQEKGFNEAFLGLSQLHSRHNQDYALDIATVTDFKQQSEVSLAKQAQIEQEDTISFEQYLHNFMQALSLKP